MNFKKYIKKLSLFCAGTALLTLGFYFANEFDSPSVTGRPSSSILLSGFAIMVGFAIGLFLKEKYKSK